MVSYSLYLAEDSAATDRMLVATVLVGTNEISVPVDTPFEPGSPHFVRTNAFVYAASILGEQSTAAASAALADKAASASSVAFTDRDLDPEMVGGTLTWSPPGDASLVAHYAVYADRGGGLPRSLVDSVPVGTNVLSVPAGTVFAQYSHLSVFTKSAAFEQSTPASQSVSDTVRAASGLLFMDADRSQCS